MGGGGEEGERSTLQELMSAEQVESLRNLLKACSLLPQVLSALS